MTPETIEKVLTDPDTIINLATQLKEERAKRVALESKVAADAPKVLFASAVETSQDTIIIRELAKLICQNGVPCGEKRCYEALREWGYLIKAKGSDYNMPTQKSMDLGLFEIKERTINSPDGKVLLKRTPKVTGKGQTYFVNLFVNKLELDQFPDGLKK